MAGNHASDRGKYVLVVEDHAPTAELLCELLQDEGYQVEWASNADKALDIMSRCDASGPDISSRCPDLILMDLTMQGLNPLDMVNRLPQVSQVTPPLILLSARPTLEVEVAARSINAAGIVHKPFEVETLLDTIEKALASAV